MIVNIESTTFHLVNAHLARSGLLIFLENTDLNKIRELAVDRAGQIKRILGVIDNKGLPTVMACDCNMTSLTMTYAQITSELQDAYRERGWGFGHTFVIPRGFDIRSDINLPFQRIDYLFHSPKLGVQSIRVIASEIGSDHRPVLARFVFLK